MFLKRIELQGFKSFADKTIIEFNEQVTGIVGPNGCGKSNVNDAIRWVLGEQSAKSLRSGNSMSDIIFSGSELRKPVNMAKVTLVFDNSKRIFNIDFDEVEISRSLSRSSNDAKYYINKSECRLKDIQELVMDTGLGRDSLSIITQGNISSFADSKPEERRLLFEEAAGVAKYKKKKKESISKLEKTKENLDRLQDILDELESRLNPLKKQAEKAAEYLKLKSELSEIEISVLAATIENLSVKKQELENSLLLDRSDLELCENEQLIKEQHADEKRKDMYALDAQIAKLQQEYTDALNQSHSLEKRKIEQDEARKYALNSKNMQEKAEALQKMLAEAKFEVENRQERLNEITSKLKEQRATQQKIQQAISSKSYERRNLDGQISSLEGRRNSLKMQSKKSYGLPFGVKTILENSRYLEGIEGLVSDKIKPQEGVEVAIETALGGSASQIITENERAASNAIAFLKKNRAGRATFLPLNVIKARYPNNVQKEAVKNCPGIIGFANELVDVQERYRNIADRFLATVLVARNLKDGVDAARLLHHQLKIVTLEGDTIHAGGAMSGGSQSSHSSAQVKKQIEQVEKELQSKNETLSKLNEEIAKLNQQDQQVSTSLMQSQIESAKLENIYSLKKEKYLSIKSQYEEAASQANFKSEEVPANTLVQEIADMHEKIDALLSSLESHRKQRYDAGQECETLENETRKLRRKASALTTDIHKQELDLEKFTFQIDSALSSLTSEYQLTYEAALAQKKDVDLKQAAKEVQRLKIAIKALGSINLDAANEYKEVKERFDFLSSQKQDLLDTSDSIMKTIDEMDEQMSKQFKEMFDKINGELDGIFKAMFGGGRANLSMTDPEDILNTGIEIEVQPPGKLVKNMQSFSGGEKALIAISVLFAILKARTIPLCIFDEVEAALDQANVERFAKYLSNFKDESQFIAVTHRPGTMEQCDCLYGVTMEKNGVSQVVRVMLKDALDLVEKNKGE